MYFLPAASWWRFIGWLILGLSVYASYGFVNSVVGKSQGPSFAKTPHKSQGRGSWRFLAAAVGMFVIPHEASPWPPNFAISRPSTRQRRDLPDRSVGIVL